MKVSELPHLQTGSHITVLLLAWRSLSGLKHYRHDILSSIHGLLEDGNQGHRVVKCYLKPHRLLCHGQYCITLAQNRNLVRILNGSLDVRETNSRKGCGEFIWLSDSDKHGSRGRVTNDTEC